MPEFRVPLPDGPVTIAHHDGELAREHTWHVKDGSTHVADADIDFFMKYVPDAHQVTAKQAKSEEAPPAKEQN